MIKSKIEWCDSTWNPVVGCYHECQYCYARRIANRLKGCDDSPDGSTGERIVHLDERLKATTKGGVIHNAAYPFGFTPTLHEYRLRTSLPVSHEEPRQVHRTGPGREAPGGGLLLVRKHNDQPRYAGVLGRRIQHLC